MGDMPEIYDRMGTKEIKQCRHRARDARPLPFGAHINIREVFVTSCVSRCEFYVHGFQDGDGTYQVMYVDTFEKSPCPLTSVKPTSIRNLGGPFQSNSNDSVPRMSENCAGNALPRKTLFYNFF